MKQFLTALIIVFLGAVAAWVAVALRPEPKKKEPEVAIPVLETIKVEPRTVHLELSSQGTVEARTETVLSAEVAGRILEVARCFEDGGSFCKGDVLLKMDAADYKAALAQAQAQFESACLALAQEKATVAQAAQDWERLGQGEPTELTLRKPQLAFARATVQSAQAQVEKAERDLERTQLVAPYDGRVVETLVDLGQYVGGRGEPLVRVYATEAFEVRLPLEEGDYALLALSDQGEVSEGSPVVRLSARIGDAWQHWQGHVVRSEAMVNERSRLRYVVARVEQPPEGWGALVPGMFLQARIEAQPVENAFAVPREALVDRETVLRVDDENRLHRQRVSVLFADAERAVIDWGLSEGDRLVVTPMEYVVEGMLVEPETMERSATPHLKEATDGMDGEAYFGRDQQMEVVQ